MDLEKIIQLWRLLRICFLSRSVDLGQSHTTFASVMVARRNKARASVDFTATGFPTSPAFRLQ